MTNDDNKKPLGDWRDMFYDATTTLSGIIRNLALAMVGIIWVFKNTDPTARLIPPELVTPLLLTVIALAADLLQYCWSAILYRIYYGINEKKSDNDPSFDTSDVSFPNYIEVITWVFFIAKIGFSIASYIYLALYLVDRI